MKMFHCIKGCIPEHHPRELGAADGSSHGQEDSGSLASAKHQWSRGGGLA